LSFAEQERDKYKIKYKVTITNLSGEPNEHPGDEAEGYVHVHAGIYGIAPIEAEEDPRLDPAENNWNNPVAQITIRRVYH